MKIIFISGIPRSGTTVLQAEIAEKFGAMTDPETWIMPFNYGRLKFHDFSVYGGKAANIFFHRFLDKQNLYSEYLRYLDDLVVSTFHTRVESVGTPIYVEKTPRNLYFLDDIERLKLRRDINVASILLIRHPLDIIDSIDTTWGNYFYSFWMLKHDLLKGLCILTNASEEHHVVSYERFVSGDVNLSELLQIDDIPAETEGSTLKMDHTDAGDPLFGKKYTQVSTSSIFKFEKDNLPVFKAFVYNRFLKKVIVKNFILKFYPDTKNFTYTYDLRNGIGLSYLFATVVSLMSQVLPLKLIGIQLKNMYMLR